MILQVALRESGSGVTIMDLTGRITLGRDCQQVEWKVEDLVKEEKKKVILNMDGVTLVDSTGVGIIVTCFGRLKRAGGELRLASVKGNVKDILTMTQLDKVMPFYPDVEAANQNF